MMVSSLLAFNACTKDGDQGPAGATGPAGPAGAAGTVGPAGATGADGTKILGGTAAPAADAGAVGDYFFDKTDKVLYGPKTDAGWGDGTTLIGATGADGKDGVNGIDGKDGAAGADGKDGKDAAKFIAGVGVDAGGKGLPADAEGVEGDYFFNTATSTFYGPKTADGWEATNVLPLGNQGAKSYFYNVVLQDAQMVPGSQVFGNDYNPAASYPDGYRIFSSYEMTKDDLIRIAQYEGWGDDREMAFETAFGLGDFTIIHTTAASLRDPATGQKPGDRFIYTGDQSTVPAIFTLSQLDLNQLTGDPLNPVTPQTEAQYDYLTYAKIDPAIVASAAEGKAINLANVKQVTVNKSTTNYTADFTAKATFNLEAIVKNYEKNLQQGGVVVARTQEYDAITGQLSGVWNTTAISQYRDQYTIGGVTWGPGLTTTNVVGPINVDPFGLNTAAAVQLGNLGANGTQELSSTGVVSRQGNFTYTYSIKSGDVGTESIGINPANGSSYYSYIGDHLVVGGNGIYTINNSNTLVWDTAKNGKTANYFNGRKIMLINVLVLDANTVEAAQKAGISLSNANALEQFVSKR